MLRKRHAREHTWLIETTFEAVLAAFTTLRAMMLLDTGRQLGRMDRKGSGILSRVQWGAFTLFPENLPYNITNVVYYCFVVAFRISEEELSEQQCSGPANHNCWNDKLETPSIKIYLFRSRH